MDTFLDELAWRGLVYDATPGLAERMRRGPVTGYVGFDPTARSLQIGNLVPVMLLAHLQRAGGRPIVLVGGGTAMIGDPSGKSAERPLLTAAEIDEHAERQRVQLARFLDFSGANAAVMVNNADWLRSTSLVPFLRDIGKHFTLSHMLQKESVRSRMEVGISYTEFSYMLLQAYDYLHLHREHGCDLQMGGSDQWGNITAGVELVRRCDAGEVHGLCAPLVTTATGAKFGKTEGGAVWLDPESTSPYRFFQFWINVDDRDVIGYLKTFTFLERHAIDELARRQDAEPAARAAQRALALDVTGRIHGGDTARRVSDAAALIFNPRGVRDAAPDTWSILEAELPGWRTTRDALPVSLVELAAAAGLTASKGETRRQLAQGGISVNGEKVGPDAEVTVGDLVAERYLWLRRGKKTDVIVRVDPAP